MYNSKYIRMCFRKMLLSYLSLNKIIDYRQKLKMNIIFLWKGNILCTHMN